MKKWYDTDFWQLLIYVLGMLLIAFLLSGCKTKYVPMEKVICRDVVKHDTLHTSDSVFVRDSIFLRQKGDTCFLDRWHEKTIYKNVYKVKVDSFLKRDSIPVPYPVERKLTRWEEFELKYAAWAMGATCVLLVLLGLYIYRRIKNARYTNINQQR